MLKYQNEEFCQNLHSDTLYPFFGSCPALKRRADMNKKGTKLHIHTEKSAYKLSWQNFWFIGFLFFIVLFYLFIYLIIVVYSIYTVGSV